MICTIDDESFNEYVEETGITPCMEYGMCEDCPFAEADE